MTPLRAAIKRWQAATPRARAEAIAFFRDEANTSAGWAKEDKVEWLGTPAKHHVEDAEALRAACSILRAARKAR